MSCDLFDLTGENAVVIGGAGGIGQAIAIGLAQAGADVAVASRKKEALEKACEEIKEASGKEARYFVVDATDEDSVTACAKEANEEMGCVQILVNSQGLNKKYPAEEFPMDVFMQMLQVNVYGMMLTCKHFGQYMIENGYGKIVNVSSTRGKIASKGPGNAAYCTTKGAVDMLTKQLASEYGPHGITVNALGPTVTMTPMMAPVIEQRGGDAYLQSLADAVPMRKSATPEDVVGTAIFLASHASDYMTGNILYPDGGLTAIG